MPELCRHRLSWDLPESCGEEGDCGHRGETHGHRWAPGYALAAGTTRTRSNSVTQVFYATSASTPGQGTSLLDQYRAGIPVAAARGHLRHWEGLAAAACKCRAPHCTPEPSQHPRDPLAGWSALTAALASSFKGSRMKKGGGGEMMLGGAVRRHDAAQFGSTPRCAMPALRGCSVLESVETGSPPC